MPDGGRRFAINTPFVEGQLSEAARSIKQTTEFDKTVAEAKKKYNK